MVNLAGIVPVGAHASRSRLTVSYKKRTPLEVMLPTRGLHVIVSGYDYVSATLITVALLVGRA